MCGFLKASLTPVTNAPSREKTNGSSIEAQILPSGPMTPIITPDAPERQLIGLQPTSNPHRDSGNAPQPGQHAMVRIICRTPLVTGLNSDFGIAEEGSNHYHVR